MSPDQPPVAAAVIVQDGRVLLVRPRVPEGCVSAVGIRAHYTQAARASGAMRHHLTEQRGARPPAHRYCW